MKVFYQGDNGEIGTLDVPFHPAERTFEQFCDFRNDEGKYIQMTKKGEKFEISDVMNQVVKMLSNLVEGDLMQIPFRHGSESIAELFEKGYKLTPDTENNGLSVLRIYAHITTSFNTYAPASIPDHFEIKQGEVSFICEPMEAAKKMVGMAYTTGQVIEVMEYQRRFVKTMNEKGHELGVGNMDFSLGMTEIALLCPMKGEKLPSDRHELDIWLGERRKVLRAVPLNVIFDLRFFLLNGLLTLKQIRITNFSLKASRRRKPKKRKPPRIATK